VASLQIESDEVIDILFGNGSSIPGFNYVRKLFGIKELQNNKSGILTFRNY